MSPPPARLPDFAYNGEIDIALGALQKNYKALRRLSTPARCAAVVKADAYGLGLAPVAKSLAAAGCTVFFVATLGEGATLRRVLPKAEIYILNGLPNGAAAWTQARRLMPCLGSLEEIAEWQAQPKPGPACLHIDTGMNRLGLSQRDCEVLRTQPARIGFAVSLVMSHLACADDPDATMNDTQRALFAQLRTSLPAAPASLANSAAVLMGKPYHFDMVRVGIGLYGGLDVPKTAKIRLAPVVSVRVPLIATRQLSAGESVGYGATYKTPAPMRVGLVSFGYADGYLRCLGHARAPFAMAHIGKYALPVIGRVSMDILALDISALPQAKARRGTMVELLGAKTGLVPLAQQANTISYELLTRLGARCKRHYRN